MMSEELDCVDECMKTLGISLNLLDPHSVFNHGTMQEDTLKVMDIVRIDYRRLSSAIHALREGEQSEN